MMHRMVSTLHSPASPFVKTALPHNDSRKFLINEFLWIRNQRPYPYVIDVRTDEQRGEWGILPEAVRMSRKSNLTIH